MQKLEVGVFLIVAAVAVFSLANLFGYFGFRGMAAQQITNTIAISGIELGDPIGRYDPVLSEFHLKDLSSGTINTPVARTKYDQFLRLRRLGDFDGGIIQFDQDSTGAAGDFLVFKDAVFEWVAQFNQGLKSRIEKDNNTNIDHLRDIQDRYLNIMGQNFAIVDTDVDTTTGNINILLWGETQVWLHDDNYKDDKFSDGSKVNNHNVDAKVKIKAGYDGSVLTIDSITYRLNAVPAVPTDPYMMVPGYYSTRNQHKTPEAFLVSGFDIFYAGAQGYQAGSRAVTNVIEFKPSGKGYSLQFPAHGSVYAINFVENAGGVFYGSNGHKLIAAESSGFFIDLEDSFVLNSKDDFGGMTRILKYDRVDTSNSRAYFEDLAGGSLEATYDSNGNGQLIVGGASYAFAIDTSSSSPSIKVDLNNDGTIGSGSAKLRFPDGRYITLGSSGGSSTTLTFTTPKRLRAEAAADETFNVVISTSSSRLDIDVTGLNLSRDKDGIDKGMTSTGVFVELNQIQHPGNLKLQLPAVPATAKVTVGRKTTATKGTVIVTLERQKVIKRVPAT